MLAAGLAAFFVHFWHGAEAHSDGPISVRAEPIVFLPAEPDRVRFGALEWRGGLRITGGESLGGLSGLLLSADGRSLTAVSDAGDWVTARLSYEGDRLSGMDRVVMTKILGAPGEKLKGKTDQDAEGLARLSDDKVLVSFERRHRIARYRRDSKGRFGRASYLKLPDTFSQLSDNKGIEALGVLPSSAPESPVLVAVAEHALNADGDHTGWLISADGSAKTFAVARSDGFDITDLAFLPGGDLVLLERRFVPVLGGAFRLRRIAAPALRAGAVLEGEILFSADDRHTLDNMEGLAVHGGEAGETVLTLVSDDNFSPAQVTLLLQFALVED